jgi:hypothetical protein
MFLQATINIRKGKKTHVYEINCKLGWIGVDVNTDTAIKGEITVSELMQDDVRVSTLW